MGSGEIWHQEANSILAYCQGSGIDVGADNRPVISADRVITIDIDPACRTHLHCDGSDLPFKDNTLDFVASLHSFEHFDDPVATLKEWLRVLKVGGYLAMVVPDKRFIPNMPVYNSAPNLGKYQVHKYDFSPEDFQELLKQFDNIEIVQFDTLKNNWSFDVVCKKTR